MTELDSVAGLDWWSISTRWTLLIVPGVFTARSPTRSHGASGDEPHTGETYATQVTPTEGPRAVTHVEVGGDVAVDPALTGAGR